eukprot:TRINITY_DN7738_c0_g1_i2.p1 TRINITY_DN7738_c0_g1~~TRINITY_DN7738_c0_g1_i2.p1  ORF type:complete len:256 (-),score=-7.53 TRINITY_DN7738_c0_g1_i2:140-907(-)
MASDTQENKLDLDTDSRKPEAPSPPHSRSSPVVGIRQDPLRLRSPDDTAGRDGAVTGSGDGDNKQDEGRSRQELSDHGEGAETFHDTHGTGGSHPASDEDPGVVDEKRQKRMLSNRESARRSRLKKQHHLDEMKQQVSQLRAENTDMVTKYNLASRHYAQITEENRALRSHAMDLSRRLQRLHHAATAQGLTMGHEYMGLAHLDPSMQLSLGAMQSSALQHPGMAHMSSMAAHVPGAHPGAFSYPFPSSAAPEIN